MKNEEAALAMLAAAQTMLLESNLVRNEAMALCRRLGVPAAEQRRVLSEANDRHRLSKEAVA